MNICFFTIYPVLPVIGGVERITVNLADYFASAEGGRHNCVLLSVKPHSAEDSRLYSLPSRWRTSPANRRFFKSFLQEHKIDVVIWQNGGSHKFLFAPICKNLGVRAISVSHGQPDYYRHAGRSKMLGFDPSGEVSFFKRLKFQLKMGWKDMSYRRLFAYNTHWSDAYVLLSEKYINVFKSYFEDGIVPCPLYAIGNVCTVSGMGGEQNVLGKKKEILFVGRLSYAHKRPDYLIRIWSLIEGRFPDWSLRLVGVGEDTNALVQLAKDLNLKNVYFEGFQNPEPYYKDAQIFCLTSAYEGFGMVLVEAAAYGCVLIAFNSFDAVEDIIDDGRNGFIVPPFDLDCYADYLSSLMADEDLREKLSRGALDVPLKFSAEEIAKKWFHVISG